MTPQFSTRIWRSFLFKNGHLRQNIPISENCVTFRRFFAPKKMTGPSPHRGVAGRERESACELPSSSDLVAPVNLIGGCSITSHRCDDHIDSSRVHQMPALKDQSEEILCLLDASSLSWKRLSYRIFGYRVVRKKILILLQKMESTGKTSNAQSSSKPRIIKTP